MNPKRMMAALVTAVVIAAASLTAVSAAAAQATEPPPPATSTASPPAQSAPSEPSTAPSIQPTTTSTATAAAVAAEDTTASSPAVTETTAAPPVVEQTGGAPTSVHTFQTPPLQGSKGAAPRALGTESYSLARTGIIKVRLVTVQLTDYKANISMDSAVSAVQATSNYWQTMSNGRLSMSVASTETFNSRSASSTQRYSDMMNTITNELGWVANPYTALVVFVSTPTLSDGAYGAGWSYNGTSGRVIMPLPASLTRSVLTHEFGHVLGLMHANSLECGSGAQDVATNSDGTFADTSCSVREYGDSMDLMGVSQTSQPTISSTLWEFGGFGTGREIRDVGKAGNSSSYTLTAWAGGADGRAVKFTDPVSGEVYYLELRLPVGYDAATATNGNRGVKIVQRFGAGSLILMPDSRRFAGYYSSRHAWQAGETFTTHAGSRVSVNWISDTAAGVTIESTAAAAVRAIADLAAVSPELGRAVTGLKTGLNGGVSQGYENGAIYWTAANGAHISSGVIRDAWGAQGWEAGPLGYPTTDVRTAPNGAKSQGYQNGAIYWTAATGARISSGVIRDAWGAQGWEAGPLGYPTTDVKTGPKSGLSQGYENGAIYWTAATGARISIGAIRDAWAAQGWEAGPLGYPTTDVRTAPNGAKSQGYENGAIYWTAATGARISSGASGMPGPPRAGKPAPSATPPPMFGPARRTGCPRATKTVRSTGPPRPEPAAHPA